MSPCFFDKKNWTSFSSRRKKANEKIEEFNVMNNKETKLMQK